MDGNSNSDLEVLTSIVAALKTLDIEAQKRTLQAVATFLGISEFKEIRNTQKNIPQAISFSENRDMSPKEFLRNKAPKTDIERIACLAYYLTHYRETPHFKTLDLSNLNTEAAQPKLSNAAFSVVNATNAGLLVQAVKGTKQLSAAGELFVQALPDREAAKASLSNMRLKKRGKKTVKNSK
jgi:hypothetical protein